MKNFNEILNKYLAEKRVKTIVQLINLINFQFFNFNFIESQFANFAKLIIKVFSFYCNS